jgi:hypothetical protein
MLCHLLSDDPRELVGGEVVQLAVPAPPVVEAFDVGEDLHLQRVAGRPGLR